jgi:hypothetical protein
MPQARRPFMAADNAQGRARRQAASTIALSKSLASRPSLKLRSLHERHTPGEILHWARSSLSRAASNVECHPSG